MFNGRLVADVILVVVVLVAAVVVVVIVIVVVVVVVVAIVVFIGTLVVLGEFVGGFMSIRKGCTMRGATNAPRAKTKCRACKYGLDFFPQVLSRSTFPPVVYHKMWIIYYYYSAVSKNIHALPTEGIRNS